MWISFHQIEKTPLSPNQAEFNACSLNPTQSFQRGSIYPKETFSVSTLQLRNLGQITSPLRTSVSSFVEANLAESSKVSSKCYTPWFLGKENDSYLLEIDQVASGSSLGRATAKLGWSLKGARVETQKGLGT